jgi:uncharacterized membrane protein YidH (DUF202 family)
MRMAVSTQAMDKAEGAARGTWGRRLARAGLAAKGVTFGLVAVLALAVAFGKRGNLEDRPGALQTLAETGAGRFLIAALAVGLAGYAFWRFAQAALGEKLESGEDVSVLKRIGYVGQGLIYAWLCVLCATLVFQADEAGSGGGGGQGEDRATRIALEQPLGRYLVIAVGLGILGAALFNLYRALTAKFREELKEEQMGPNERRWYTVLGVAGHLARAVIFGLAGLFLVRAAWEYDPNEAIGLDGALAKLAQADYGQLLLGCTAAGLLAYGAFCFVQARYREL